MSLEELDLSSNNITSICNKTFTGLTNVNEIRLQESSIRSICSGTFAELTNLKEIDLEDNENTIECCEVQRFITWIQQNPSIKVYGKCRHQSQSTVIQTFTVTECPPPVYGCWTYFGPWGVCSKTCGGGQQSRTRTCTNPPPAHGGDECQGSYQQIKSCQEQHCPGTPEYGNKGKGKWYNRLFNFLKKMVESGIISFQW
ncbi:properdin-like isoform X3 [Mytilus californianus]|uniref:properdin-like isoform X3 n=1 Tax=Mytilus californianus TaxID=6549 RepID=UPI0022451442|nr:properdin-like isoform X3 [Mytilus californianus]